MIQGKAEVLGVGVGTYPGASFPTANRVWTGLRLNLGFRGKKPATNCLSYSRATYIAGFMGLLYLFV